VQVVVRVGVFHVGGSNVELIVWRKVFVVIVEGQLLRHLLSNKLAGLVGPCSGNVSHSVATTAEHNDRYAEALHVLDAVGVACHTQVEAAQSVTRQAVSAALKYDGFRAVVGHDGLDGRLENVLVGLIGDSVAQREVDGVVLARAYTDIAELTGAGEVLAVFVERDGHDTVGCVEGLFDTIAVVHVDIDVQNALLVAKQLDNTKDNVCERLAWSQESTIAIVLPLT
jgi:hypothetical protein